MVAIYGDLKDKVVLVSGGGSGIGEAIVRRFAEQKCRVAFIDIAKEQSDRLAVELSANACQVQYEHADLRDIAALRAAIARVADRFGPVQILINNAAHDERHATNDVTPEYWDDRIAVNLKHQFFAAQAVLPAMQAAKEGVIVNFGSFSWMDGQGGMVVYSSSKSAVLGMTRSLARDYGRDNIRVNAIAPGWIMTQRQKEQLLTPDGLREIGRRQCLKRLIMPDEVARFTVFLASEEASACTSQQYVIDGGWI